MRPCAARCDPVRVEHRVDVPQAADRLIRVRVSPTSTTNRFLTIGWLTEQLASRMLIPASANVRDMSSSSRWRSQPSTWSSTRNAVSASPSHDTGVNRSGSFFSITALGQSSRWIVIPRPARCSRRSSPGTGRQHWAAARHVVDAVDADPMRGRGAVVSLAPTARLEQSSAAVGSESAPPRLSRWMTVDDVLRAISSRAPSAREVFFLRSRSP